MKLVALSWVRNEQYGQLSKCSAVSIYWDMAQKCYCSKTFSNQMEQIKYKSQYFSLWKLYKNHVLPWVTSGHDLQEFPSMAFYTLIDIRGIAMELQNIAVVEVSERRRIRKYSKIIKVLTVFWAKNEVACEAAARRCYLSTAEKTVAESANLILSKDQKKYLPAATSNAL